MPYFPTPAAVHRLTARMLALGLACLWTCAGVAAAQGYNLPTLGEPASTTLTPAEEQRLGERVASQILQFGQMLEDPEVRQYLRQIGARLLEPTDYSVDGFHFFVVDDSTINAFALPGGYVAVNAGLILKTASESELASVMAHEISHVTQRHIARQIEATKGTQWATLAALLAAAVAAGGDGDAIQAAITGSISAIQQQRISYTRAHEYEADRIGIRMLAAAHFDPDAMARFFETMQRRSRLYGTQLPQILLTHPVNNTRIAEARTRAADYPSPTVNESADYPIIKERVRVLTNFQRSTLLDYYRRLGAPDNTSAAEDYGYALTLARVGEAEQAIGILRPLVQSAPEQSLYTTALARAQATAGQVNAALATLKQALQRFPSNAAIKLEYATTLLNSGQPQAARSFLLDHRQLSRNSYKAQQLLARAAGTEGHMGEAYYRKAQYYRLRGAYVPAIRDLRGALHNADLTTLDRNRIDALLDQIIAQCKVAWPDGGCRQRVLNPQRH